MPKISVIIPCYNVSKYLKQCLDSIISQTFTDFEIICINDGSTDNCGQILAEYATKDSRIKVITQKNQGLSMARNAGLKQATGTYIQFVDSDDAIHPQCLEICYTLAEKEKVDMVSFDFAEQIQKEKIQTSQIRFKILENIFPYLFKNKKYGVSINVWTKFYKKSLICDIKFIPEIHYEDWPFICAVLSKNPKTVLCSEKLYFYTQNPASITHQTRNPKQIQDYFSGIKYVVDYYKNINQIKQLKNISKYCFTPILKQQLNHCLRADKSVQVQMFQDFSSELRYLKEQGLLCWYHHKFSRYLKYKKLIKKGTI